MPADALAQPVVVVQPTPYSHAFLSIDEVEGNTTAISHYTSTGAGPRTTLHEKVFCVLDVGGDYPNLHKPVHTQNFSPRHLSALTLHLRAYNQFTSTFVPYSGSKVGLWFKLTTDDC